MPRYKQSKVQTEYNMRYSWPKSFQSVSKPYLTPFGRGGKSRNPFLEASALVKYCQIAESRPLLQLHFIAFLSNNFFKDVKIYHKI